MEVKGRAAVFFSRRGFSGGTVANLGHSREIIRSPFLQSWSLMNGRPMAGYGALSKAAHPSVPLFGKKYKSPLCRNAVSASKRAS